MKQAINIQLIVILMLVAGVLGGTTNFLRTDQEEKSLWVFGKNLLLGICAAVLIPLFLNMISSDLLENTVSNDSALFVFFGFCLIAALSSTAFINNMAARLQQEISQTKKDIEQVRESADPVIAEKTEPSETVSMANLPSGEIKNVLKALDHPKYVWRSASGLAKQTSMARETILIALDWLVSKGFVKRSETGRWGLTLEGRRVLLAVDSDQDS